jgi:anti-anti-sigma regulatory factor
MASASFTMNSGVAEIQITGSAVIDTAVAVQETFLDVLKTHTAVVLNVEKVTDCDCSFVQLISSFCYTLNKAGYTLKFSTDTLPEPILQSIKTLGFSYKKNCTRNNTMECFLTKVMKKSEQKMEPQL